MTKTRSRKLNKQDELDGVTVEIVDITPEFAEELLEQNTHNRSLKPQVIARYVDDLKNGEWCFNGDAIRISIDGQLLDGQHRLLAIAESQVTVPMILVDGIRDRAQMTIDSGVNRSYSDHLKLSGEQFAVRLAATIRLFSAYEDSVGKERWSETKSKRSNAYLDGLFKKHPRLRDSAQAAAHYRGGKFKFPLAESVSGVAHYVLHKIDGADAEFFFEGLHSGVGLFDHGQTQPILKLRQYILSPRDTIEHRRAYVVLGSVFRSWNAFREGREITNPTPRLGGAKPENYPWPA